MLTIAYAGTFRRDLKTLIANEPDLRETIDTAISRFQKNPTDSRLGMHVLRHRMLGKWAINVTDDIRIVFEWFGTSTVRFLAIGGHEKVYPTKK